MIHLQQKEKHVIMIRKLVSSNWYIQFIVLKSKHLKGGKMKSAFMKGS